MIKLKTKKLIDISHYSDRSEKLRKIEFSNIRVFDDPDTGVKKFSYIEKIIKDEGVTQEIPKYDENGQPVLDEDGNQVIDVRIIDTYESTRQVPPENIPYSVWFQLKELIYAQLPAELSEEEKYKLFLKEGMKYYIVQNGFYHGQFTIQDFE
jgi:hypothetical protein